MFNGCLMLLGCFGMDKKGEKYVQFSVSCNCLECSMVHQLCYGVFLPACDLYYFLLLLSAAELIF